MLVLLPDVSPVIVIRDPINIRELCKYTHLVSVDRDGVSHRRNNIFIIFRNMTFVVGW